MYHKRAYIFIRMAVEKSKVQGNAKYIMYAPSYYAVVCEILAFSCTICGSEIHANFFQYVNEKNTNGTKVF